MARDAADGWVFGYGSLMWKPGFDYAEVVEARLYGYHRALCVYSHVYRGTPERPGLVLGLDRGGSCRGRAFRIDPAAMDAVVAYLDARELVTDVYRRIEATVATSQGRVRAVTYVARRDHLQYAGRLPEPELVRLINQGHGRGGPNPDYVINTVAHLEEMGIVDGPLHRLAECLKGSTPAAG